MGRHFFWTAGHKVKDINIHKHILAQFVCAFPSLGFHGKQRHHLLIFAMADGDTVALVLQARHRQCVEELFDDYADDFDEHLTSLGYEVPKFLPSIL